MDKVTSFCHLKIMLLKFNEILVHTTDHHPFSTKKIIFHVNKKNEITVQSGLARC
jgi:HKD family nuclease